MVRAGANWRTYGCYKKKAGPQLQKTGVMRERWPSIARCAGVFFVRSLDYSVLTQNKRAGQAKPAMSQVH